MKIHDIIKNIAILVAAFLVTPAAFAYVCSPYMSATAGIDDGSWEFADHLVPTRIKDSRSRGADGYLSTGCDFVFGKFSLGTEFAAGISNSIFHRKSTVSFKLRFKNSFSLGLVPGYVYNGQEFFMRVMGTWEKLQFETTNPSYAGLDFNGYYPGATLGLGIVAPITPQFAIRSEYDYSYFSQISQGDQTNFKSISYRPEKEMFLMGVTYYFVPRFRLSHLKPLLQGFYLGTGFGRDLPTIMPKLSGLDQAGVVTEEPFGLKGWVNEVLAGYKVRFASRAIIGLESDASISDAFFKHSENPNDSYKYKLRQLYVLRGILGIVTSPSNDLFALGGPAYGHFIKTGGQTNSGLNFNKYFRGWQVGLGDQFALSSHLSGRLVFTYAQFRTMSSLATDGNTNRIKPLDERVVLNLIYTL